MALRPDLLDTFVDDDKRVEAWSGVDPHGFREFLTEALKVYLVLRKYAGLFMACFLPLTRMKYVRMWRLLLLFHFREFTFLSYLIYPWRSPPIESFQAVTTVSLRNFVEERFQLHKNDTEAAKVF